MKISVLGGGAMGANHARVLKEMGHLDFIVEPNEQMRDALASRFGFDKVVDNVDKTDSAGYVIATPSSTHGTVAYELLQRGKDILIEKPVCTTVEQALLLRPFARDVLIGKAGLTVAVGHIERFNPVVMYAWEWAKKNPIKVVNSYRLSPCPPRIKDVGVIMDLAIHDVDAQLYLVGSKVKSVYATAFYPEGSKYEHYGKLVLEFENGSIGTVEVSWLHSFRVRKMDITSAITCATVDYLQQSIITQAAQASGEHLNGFGFQLSSQRSEVSVAKQEPLKLELEDFIDTMQDRTNPFVTLDDGIEALKVIEAAYLSLRTKSVVLL